MELADDEGNVQWTDELLERLKEARGLTLMIEVYNLCLLPSIFIMILIFLEGQRWTTQHPLGG
jgi:hypothetical protein